MTLDEIRERLGKTKDTLGSWFHNIQFTYDRAAVACNIPLDHWDEMSAEHQGRTIAVWESERTMCDWISYLSAQGAERERKARSGK
jgi:hypothetical protein